MDHLEAAVALWDYCAASLQLIFRDSLGNPHADRIHDALRDGALSRTAISNLFGRNAKAAAIQTALDELRDAGKARAFTDGSGSGRPVEVWEVVT